MAKSKKSEVQIDRRGKASERRTGGDRRKKNEPVAIERREAPRRKVQRRRQIDPTTCERDYSDPEIEFMQALDAYKRRSGRMFPTCSEILEVIRDLGYVRMCDVEMEDAVDQTNAEPSSEEPQPSEATE
ncbi:MAG: hypothetical protein RIC55_15850 [Pirellulaceae bacterium]